MRTTIFGRDVFVRRGVARCHILVDAGDLRSHWEDLEVTEVIQSLVFVLQGNQFSWSSQSVILDPRHQNQTEHQTETLGLNWRWSQPFMQLLIFHPFSQTPTHTLHYRNKLYANSHPLFHSNI